MKENKKNKKQENEWFVERAKQQKLQNKIWHYLSYYFSLWSTGDPSMQNIHWL